ESEGLFADLTLSGEVDDGEDALDWLLARPEVDSTRLGVAGHSFGGLVSVLLAARRPEDVRAIAPMSAVFDAPARFRRNFAAREPEWRARQAIALGPGGPMLKVSFLDDLAGWDVREHARRVRAPALIVHGTADESVPTSDAAELASFLRPELVSVHLIEGADHVYSDAGALREVQGLVAEWFSDRL
ncbi:MAG TPA: alpha/beta fold hydrolase, partial [Dehalococcoidia bacterium]|nr:alpha/beta fold hydrolase [Dehalococcoidia bacterium]